jgi:nucleoside-diphosphate-sugar epimerase
MRVFIAGATGTLGRPVVRALVSRGHQVVGLTRTDEGARRIQATGAKAVIGNALDAERMKKLVVEARPDVVVHLLTAIPPAGVMRKNQLRPTNELRVTGTANLIGASMAAGARRLVAESFVGIYAGGNFSRPASEDDPLPPAPDGPFKDPFLALRSLEDQLRHASAQSGIETVALRIGFLYGSDVPSTRHMIDQARAGRMFVPAGLSGIGPFVHNDDAAAAIVAAIERPNVSGVYNVVDNQPMPMTDFISQLAAAVAAPRPKTMPAWVVKLMAPLIAALAGSRLVLDNSKAKRELGWTPLYPTVAEGLKEVRSLLAAA